MNLLRDLPPHLDEESICSLLVNRQLRIERIVSTGQSSAEGFWYDQAEDEWVLVLTGRGVVEFEDGRIVELNAGDYLLIPARCRHRVRETSSGEPTVWLAVFWASPSTIHLPTAT